MKPGQILDLPEEVAAHAVKRSVVLDDTGDFIRHKVDFLANVDQSKVKEIALYECPFAASGQCDARPFKSAKDLKAHLEGHWELSPDPMAPKPTLQPQSVKR